MTMKYINKILMLLIVSCIFGACTIHDQIDEIARIGKVAPTVYWELGSTEIIAGADAGFTLQYYPMDNKSINFVELWYDIQSTTSMSLTAAAITYTVGTDTVVSERMFQRIASYPHSQDLWNDTQRAYVLTSNFPTSYTLSPVKWSNVKVFDYEKFNSLFPAGYLETFRDSLYTKLGVIEMRKILTVDSPRIPENEFLNYVDSTYNENAGAYDYFFKENSKAFIKETFYKIQPDSLLYNSSEGTFNVVYTKKYTLNAAMRVTDSEGIVGQSELKEIVLQ